jgi:hypothetical protein
MIMRSDARFVEGSIKTLNAKLQGSGLATIWAKPVGKMTGKKVKKDLRRMMETKNGFCHDCESTESKKRIIRHLEARPRLHHHRRLGHP